MHRIHHRATYNHYFIGWELSPKLILSPWLSAWLWRLVESTVKWQLTPKDLPAFLLQSSIAPQPFHFTSAIHPTLSGKQLCTMKL
jgi:hypothetical protein